MPRATRAVIDTSCLAHNVRTLKACLQENCRMMAVVKANAYGHGSVEVSRVALKNGAQWLGVAMAEEGAVLRENGIGAPILILGASPISNVDLILRWDLRCAVFDETLLLALQNAAREKNSKVRAHLKLDTGMHRIGIGDPYELKHLLEVWKRCPNVILEGVFTHFANADSPDLAYAHQQAACFSRLLDVVRGEGYNPIVHAANTAATLVLPEYHFDMVRCGIGLYGYYPDRDMPPTVKLMPAMTWLSEITRVFSLEEAESVGYGRTYVAPSPRRVAAIALGYGDGYPRIFSNRGFVLINGQRAPLIGRVCMDQCTADITEIVGVEPGDEVVLMSQGKELNADTLASWADTISYEIVLGVSERVPREYI